MRTTGLVAQYPLSMREGLQSISGTDRLSQMLVGHRRCNAVGSNGKATEARTVAQLKSTCLDYTRAFTEYVPPQRSRRDRMCLLNKGCVSSQCDLIARKRMNTWMYIESLPKERKHTQNYTECDSPHRRCLTSRSQS